MASPAAPRPRSGAPLFLALGALIAAANIANLLWWSTAFDRGTTQAERVAIYQDGLPGVLGRMTGSGQTWLLAGVALVGALLALRVKAQARRPRLSWP